MGANWAKDEHNSNACIFAVYPCFLSLACAFQTGPPHCGTLLDTVDFQIRVSHCSSTILTPFPHGLTLLCGFFYIRHLIFPKIIALIRLHGPCS